MLYLLEKGSIPLFSINGYSVLYKVKGDNQTNAHMHGNFYSPYHHVQ